MIVPQNKTKRRIGDLLSSKCHAQIDELTAAWNINPTPDIWDALLAAHQLWADVVWADNDVSLNCQGVSDG